MKKQTFDVVDGWEESAHFGFDSNTWITLEVEFPETEKERKYGYGPFLNIICSGRQNPDFWSQFKFSHITPEGCDLLIKQLKEVKKYLKENTKLVGE